MLTLTALCMTFMLLINVMAEQLQRTDMHVLTDLESIPMGASSDKGFGNNIGRMQRKPKAAYERVFGDTESNQVVNDVFWPKGKVETKEVDEDYVYEEDIYKVVIQGDLDNDSEEDYGEYLDKINNKNPQEISENRKVNTVDKSLRFSKKYKYHSKKHNNSKHKSSKDIHKDLNTKRHPHVKSVTIHDIVQTNGIYWSDTVQNLVPKGKKMNLILVYF